MKLRRGLRILFGGTICMLWCACAMQPRSGVPAVVGTWTNSFGTLWTLNSSGTFDVDLNHNHKRDAWGTFTVEGDTITLVGTGGIASADCKGTGVYRFTRGGDTLRFRRVHDACKLRVKNVMLVWHRK